MARKVKSILEDPRLLSPEDVDEILKPYGYRHDELPLVEGHAPISAYTSRPEDYNCMFRGVKVQDLPEGGARIWATLLVQYKELQPKNKSPEFAQVLRFFNLQDLDVEVVFDNPEFYIINHITEAPKAA